MSGSLHAARVPGVSGNVSAAHASGTFASVRDQAGIYAGTDGYQVDVRGHTQVDGGVIASSAAPERNSFTTRTLGFSDIQNGEAWSSRQTSFGGGYGSGGSDANGHAVSGQGEVPGSARGGAGRVSAGLPVALSASGSQASVTRSAISAGALTVTSGDPASQAAAAAISRDAGTANEPLEREFTAEKRDGLEREFDETRTLGNESETFLANRARDADQWAKDHPDALSENPYGTWMAGGTGQRAITAIVGAASGDVGGSIGGFAQQAVATLAQGYATEQVKSLVGNDDEHPVLRALAQGAVGCLGSVAGGAGSCGSAALGAATSVGVHELLKTGATPAVDADGNWRNSANQSIGSGAGTHSVAAIVSLAASHASRSSRSATRSPIFDVLSSSCGRSSIPCLPPAQRTVVK